MNIKEILLIASLAYLNNCTMPTSTTENGEEQRPENSQQVKQLVVEYSRLISSRSNIIDVPEGVKRIGLEFQMESGVILKEDINELDLLPAYTFTIAGPTIYVNTGSISAWENLTSNRVLNIIVTY